jgi:ubiquinone/menaquinone biosynthesis C-methylase UbiE
VVIASEILEHVPEDDSAIAELVRVLRPGGRLAVNRFANTERLTVVPVEQSGLASAVYVFSGLAYPKHSKHCVIEAF